MGTEFSQEAAMATSQAVMVGMLMFRSTKPYSPERISFSASSPHSASVTS